MRLVFWHETASPNCEIERIPSIAKFKSLDLCSLNVTNETFYAQKLLTIIQLHVQHANGTKTKLSKANIESTARKWSFSFHCQCSYLFFGSYFHMHFHLTASSVYQQTIVGSQFLVFFFTSSLSFNGEVTGISAPLSLIANARGELLCETLTILNIIFKVIKSSEWYCKQLKYQSLIAVCQTGVRERGREPFSVHSSNEKILKITKNY